jgi:hypothetical protein
MSLRLIITVILRGRDVTENKLLIVAHALLNKNPLKSMCAPRAGGGDGDPT